MSVVKVRSAIETAVNGLTGGLTTVWQGENYKPTVGTAFQRCAVFFATPVAMEMSGNWHREVGFFDIVLFYPTKAGTGAAEARVDVIRATFYRGASFTASGVTVVIENTPHEAPPLPDDDWLVIPVRVPFYAHILRA